MAKVNVSQFLEPAVLKEEERLLEAIIENMESFYIPPDGHFSVSIQGFRQDAIDRVVAAYRIAGWQVEESYEYSPKILRFS